MQEPTALSIRTSEPVLRQAATAPAQLVRKMLVVSACAVLMYSVALALADYQAVQESLRKLPGHRLALSLLIASASFSLRFARWQRYLHWLDIRVSWLDSALIYICGLGMSITPGKAGELLKPLMLQQVTGVALVRGVPILVAERITDAMALVLLASIGLLPSPLGIALVCAALVGCIALACISGSRTIGQWLIDRACRLRWLARHKERLRDALDASLALCSPWRLFEGFVWSLLAWATHSLCLFSLAHVFDVVPLTLGKAFLIDSAPSLAGALSMLPGGLGLIEASMTGALIALAPASVTPALAAAITLAVRVTTLWWAVLLGLSALGVWQLRQRAPRHAQGLP